MNKNINLLSLFSVLFCLLIISPTLQATELKSGWRFQLTPYVWFIKANGNLDHGLRGVPNVSIKRSRGDILKDLNAAAFFSYSARKNHWVILGDYSYASLTERDDLPFGLRAKTKLKQQIASILGGVQVARTDNYGVDVLAGARYWHVRTELDVQPIQAQKKLKKSFVEPVVGLRGRLNFGAQKRWSLIGYADVGGMGNGSRHSWQALASLNYAIRPQHHISVGYRHLKLHYNSQGARVKVDLSGPLLGYSYQF